MRILGIESSCDDSSVAIVDDGNRVIINLTASQIDLHRPFGGVVPEVASRAHCENLLPLVHRCMEETDCSLDEIDGIATTYGPGLAGCLLTGLSLGKSLAYATQKPLIGINHLEAHVYTSVLDQPDESHPPFPHLSLLVSGGHTSLYRIDHWDKLTPLGRTLDDAAGEAFDKVAKVLGLGFPGGPIIQQRSEGFDGEWIQFPRPMLHTKNFDFSFSGLKTAVINYVRKNEMTEEAITRVAASFQQAAVDVLVAKTLRAAEEHQLKHISLVGGVACNQSLRETLTQRANKRRCNVYLPHKRYAQDNGAMIAGLAFHHLKAGRTSGLSLNAHP